VVGEAADEVDADLRGVMARGRGLALVVVSSIEFVRLRFVLRLVGSYCIDKLLKI